MARKYTAQDRYILIVEDSPVDYEIIRRSLQKAGIQSDIHHCQDGDSALDFLMGKKVAALDKGAPSLILLDLNLPGTDGRQVLGEIKAHETLKAIPVIVLSTSNNSSDIEACYMKGSNSYVQKPLAPDDFVELANALKTFWFDQACLPGNEEIHTS